MGTTHMYIGITGIIGNTENPQQNVLRNTAKSAIDATTKNLKNHCKVPLQ